MAMKELNAIRKMKRRKPFMRFRIVTTGGDKYLVEDLFQFAVAETKVMYVFPASDRFIELKSEQIAGIEELEVKGKQDRKVG
jgi:hypothetical protein